MRRILSDEGMPQPDDVEYAETSIFLFWHEPKVVIQITDIPHATSPS